ncbi:MAG: glycosyltransferase [Pseudomonadota bacterium]
MRILLITGYFPPHCPAATTRAPSFARYLLGQGHDVRVLCPDRTKYESVISAGLPAGRVHYVRLPDVDAWIRRLKDWLGRGRSRKAYDMGKARGERPPALARPAGVMARFRAKAASLYYSLAYFPDRQWPWIRPARRAGDALLRQWRPDVIYVSAPTFSPFFVASYLHRRTNIPWVAEYRDAWVLEPNYSHPWLRRVVERWLEKRVTASAAMVVCVTAQTAKRMAAYLKRPTLCAQNGYDQEDFDALPPPAPLDRERLTILYAGAVYAGHRDPTPLFAALAAMGDGRKRYQVIVHTGETEIVAAQAARLGVEDVVAIEGLIPRHQVLAREMAADVLLLLRGTGTHEDSVVPGKLFEYIGARRPILALGSTTGEADDIIRDQGFGFVSKEAGEIGVQLEHWHAEKMTHGGRLPAPPGDAGHFTRARQFAIVLEELQRLTGLQPEGMARATSSR